MHNLAQNLGHDRKLSFLMLRTLFGMSLLSVLVASCQCGAPAGVAEGEGEGEGEASEGEGEGVAGAPTVNITSPADGAFVRAGDSVTFACSANDDVDGAIPNGDISWDASADGPLGVGAVVTNALVTLGAQEIRCSAVDSEGRVGFDTVTVTVVDQFPPTATIVQPADESFFGANATITFSGNAFDAEDGAVPNASLRWLSDGASIGIGAAVTTALPLGDHVITFEATDADGAVGIDTVTIHVVDNLPPACFIITPQNGAALGTGQSVTFSASCSDPDGGAIANDAYAWSSSVDGALGVGATVANALVTAGGHTITVCAADPSNAAILGCASVDVTVGDNAAPNITSARAQGGAGGVNGDGVTFQACNTVDLVCAAFDPEGQAVTFSWSSNLEGNIGNQPDVGWDPNVSGTHVVTCTARDAQGVQSTRSITVFIESPSVELRQPQQGDNFTQGDTIAFDGRGCDTESGDLTGNQLVWISSINGQFGVDEQVDFSGLDVGTHVITLRGSDGVNIDEASVTITVDP